MGLYRVSIRLMRYSTRIDPGAGRKLGATAEVSRAHQTPAVRPASCPRRWHTVGLLRADAGGNFPNQCLAKPCKHGDSTMNCILNFPVFHSTLAQRLEWAGGAPYGGSGSMEPVEGDDDGVESKNI